jgi:hypothetical protein
LLRGNWNLSQLSPRTGISMPIAAPAQSQLWNSNSPISAMTMVAMTK